MSEPTVHGMTREQCNALNAEIIRLTAELAELKHADTPGTITVCHQYITADTPGYDPRVDMDNQQYRYWRGV